MRQTAMNEWSMTIEIPREPYLAREMTKKAISAAQEYESEMDFCAGSMRINAKSTVMASAFLEACRGRTVEVVIRGPDAVLAVKRLVALFIGGNPEEADKPGIRGHGHL